MRRCSLIPQDGATPLLGPPPQEGRRRGTPVIGEVETMLGEICQTLGPSHPIFMDFRTRKQKSGQ